MARWFEVDFSLEELALLVRETEQAGYKYGQMGTDVHERLQMALGYAMSLKGSMDEPTA